MRILIYGAGVIGSIFAGKLLSSGHDVTMLARNTRLDVLRADGLILKDISKQFTEQYAVKAIDTLAANDIYDYIFVTMQFLQIDAILQTLAENKSRNIVVCINNPNGYAKWLAYLGDKLMLGFPACGGETEHDITELFISKGMTRLFQTTTFGEPDGKRTERLTILVCIFRSCGIPSVISNRMDNWQKCHLSVVSPIAGAILKNGGNAKALAANRPDIKTMIRSTREGFTALKALGLGVEPIKLNFYYMPALLLSFVFSIIFRTRIAEYSMEKHTNNAKPELKELQESFEALIKDTRTEKQNIYALSKYLYAD